MKQVKKRAITLLEIMIVIFLIGLIGSVIGINMKGSMDKGRAFKSERAKEQIKDILQLQLAEGVATNNEIAQDPTYYLKRSGMVKKPKDLLKDGWGQPFVITATADGAGFSVKSERLKKYKDSQKSKGNVATPAPTQ